VCCFVGTIAAINSDRICSVRFLRRDASNLLFDIDIDIDIDIDGSIDFDTSIVVCDKIELPCLDPIAAMPSWNPIPI